MIMFSLGIDIGGTKCAVVLGKDKPGDNVTEFILDKIKFPTDVSRGWRAVVDEILLQCDTLLSGNGVSREELIGVGISCGGPLDSKRGIINCPPNLPDWDGVPIVSIVQVS